MTDLHHPTYLSIWNVSVNSLVWFIFNWSWQPILINFQSSGGANTKHIPHTKCTGQVFESFLLTHLKMKNTSGRQYNWVLKIGRPLSLQLSVFGVLELRKLVHSELSTRSPARLLWLESILRGNSVCRCWRNIKYINLLANGLPARWMAGVWIKRIIQSSTWGGLLHQLCSLEIMQHCRRLNSISPTGKNILLAAMRKRSFWLICHL